MSKFECGAGFLLYCDSTAYLLLDYILLFFFFHPQETSAHIFVAIFVSYLKGGMCYYFSCQWKEEYVLVVLSFPSYSGLKCTNISLS